MTDRVRHTKLTNKGEINHEKIFSNSNDNRIGSRSSSGTPGRTVGRNVSLGRSADQDPDRKKQEQAVLSRNEADNRNDTRRPSWLPNLPRNYPYDLYAERNDSNRSDRSSAYQLLNLRINGLATLLTRFSFYLPR